MLDRLHVGGPGMIHPAPSHTSGVTNPEVHPFILWQQFKKLKLPVWKV